MKDEEQPQQHVTLPPAEPRTERRSSQRIYIHPVLLVATIFGLVLALALTVYSFNLRWDAAEVLNTQLAAASVEIEKCRGDLRVLEVERAQKQDLLVLATAQEIEGEALSKLARTGGPNMRDAVDSIRAITRRYIFAHAGDSKDRVEVTRELCAQYHERGFSCY